MTPPRNGSELSERRGRLLVFLAALLWSLAGIFIKFLDLHPLTIVFYRSLFASLVFLPFLKIRQAQLDSSIIISVLSYSTAITAFVSANKLTSAANAIVLQYTAPVFVFLFSRFVLGEPISRANALALALSMIGVAVISFESAGEPAMSGVLLAILSGLLFAVYMVNLQQIKTAGPIWLNWINNAICALLILPFVSSRLTLSTDQLCMVALMGAVQLGLPYFLFSKGLRSISVQEAALIALSEPILNPLWVAVFFGEIPSPATLAGGSFIVLGLGVRYLWPLSKHRIAAR